MTWIHPTQKYSMVVLANHPKIKLYAMHITLAPGKVAHLNIVNILDQGDGDSFEFLKTGFSAEKCLVNGVEQNFSDYLKEHNVDTRYPLVADLFRSDDQCLLSGS